MLPTNSRSGGRSQLSWADDGRLFAGSGRELLCWKPGDDEKQVVFLNDRGIGRAGVNLQGTKVALRDDQFWLLDLETGEAVWSVDDVPWLNTLAWSPSGDRIVTAHHDHTSRVWDASTGAELLRVAEKNPMTGVDWSPDGTRFATQSVNGWHAVWDAVSGERLAAGISRASTFSFRFGIKWDPTGDRLASIGGVGGVTVWTIEGAELVPRYFHKKSKGMADVDWSPDGTRIVVLTTTGEVRLFDSETGSITMQSRILPHHGTPEGMDLEWSPDGKTIVFCAKDWGELRYLSAPEWTPRN